MKITVSELCRIIKEEMDYNNIQAGGPELPQYEIRSIHTKYTAVNGVVIFGTVYLDNKREFVGTIDECAKWIKKRAYWLSHGSE